MPKQTPKTPKQNPLRYLGHRERRPSKRKRVTDYRTESDTDSDTESVTKRHVDATTIRDRPYSPYVKEVLKFIVKDAPNSDSNRSDFIKWCNEKFIYRALDDAIGLSEEAQTDLTELCRMDFVEFMLLLVKAKIQTESLQSFLYRGNNGERDDVYLQYINKNQDVRYVSGLHLEKMNRELCLTILNLRDEKFLPVTLNVQLLIWNVGKQALDIMSQNKNKKALKKGEKGCEASLRERERRLLDNALEKGLGTKFYPKNATPGLSENAGLLHRFFTNSMTTDMHRRKLDSHRQEFGTSAETDPNSYFTLEDLQREARQIHEDETINLTSNEDRNPEDNMGTTSARQDSQETVRDSGNERQHQRDNFSQSKSVHSTSEAPSPTDHFETKLKALFKSLRDVRKEQTISKLEGDFLGPDLSMEDSILAQAIPDDIIAEKVDDIIPYVKCYLRYEAIKNHPKRNQIYLRFQEEIARLPEPTAEIVRNHQLG